MLHRHDGHIRHSRSQGMLIVLPMFSYLSASTLRSAGSNHDMPMFSVFCHFGRHLVFGHISSFIRSRHLSFGLLRFRFPSTGICNIFLVASSLSRLCTCPNHLNLFSVRILPSGTCRAQNCERLVAMGD